MAIHLPTPAPLSPHPHHCYLHAWLWLSSGASGGTGPAFSPAQEVGPRHAACRAHHQPSQGCSSPEKDTQCLSTHFPLMAMPDTAATQACSIFTGDVIFLEISTFPIVASYTCWAQMSLPCAWGASAEPALPPCLADTDQHTYCEQCEQERQLERSVCVLPAASHCPSDGSPSIHPCPWGRFPLW